MNYLEGAEDDGPLTTTVQINGEEYKAFIDTGAARSIISEATARKFKSEVMTKSTPLKLILADGRIESCETETTVESRITLAGRPTEVPITFSILKGEKHKILIGTDTLRQLGLLTKDSLFVQLVNENVREDDDGDDIEVNSFSEESKRPGPTIPEGPLKESLKELVDEFRDLFEPIGPTPAMVEPMRIPLKDDAALVQCKPRKLDEDRRRKVKEEIQRLTDSGITRESFGPFSSPIVVVNKKNGQIRLCVDYTQLNQNTVRDHFPLPDLRTFVQEADGAELFASIELTAGYHQMPIHQEDIGYHYVRLVQKPDPLLHSR